MNERKNRIVDLAQNEALEADCEVVGFADSEEGKIVTLVNGRVLVRPFDEVMKVIYPGVEAEPPSKERK
ncbi:MAG: hypothetical protein IT368_12680 [Candidatus Hydrogenedentes bacterium]|nr:hypothetical protein [Candidatus Hydrogenedentota bacterium]